jgi:hypothetical protein
VIIRTQKVRHESIPQSIVVLDICVRSSHQLFPYTSHKPPHSSCNQRIDQTLSGPSQLMEHQTWRSCQVRPELFSTHGHHPSVPNLKKMATEGGTWTGRTEQHRTEKLECDRSKVLDQRPAVAVALSRQKLLMDSRTNSPPLFSLLFVNPYESLI